MSSPLRVNFKLPSGAAHRMRSRGGGGRSPAVNRRRPLLPGADADRDLGFTSVTSSRVFTAASKTAAWDVQISMRLFFCPVICVISGCSVLWPRALKLCMSPQESLASASWGLWNSSLVIGSPLAIKTSCAWKMSKKIIKGKSPLVFPDNGFEIL